MTVAIGLVTEEILEELGVKVDAVPDKYTIEVRVDTLVDRLEASTPK